MATEKGRPRNEEVRKIFCEIVEGVVYSDRCLYKLSKVIEGNKSCEDCILRKFEKIKPCGAKNIQTSIKKRGRPKESQRVGKNLSSSRAPKIPKGETEPAKDASQITKQSYSMQVLISLLGKSERTIREWAEKGKIPAHKVGKKWRFPKEEIDCWLLEQKGDTNGTQEIEDQQEMAMPLTQFPGDPHPDNNQERSNLPIVDRVSGDLDHEENE